ncbi:MAG: HTTM domain-containing protein [bacterium]|nr:HTTM domain-containing protein [bacterium]
MVIETYLEKKTSIAPLIIFRIGFGFLLFLSMLRFWSKGWIESLYISPTYHFTFYGFEFVQPFGVYTYLLFLVCALSALMVMLGYFYRISAILLFLSFTYIELMDQSTYLNHYYFISLMALLLVFLPANGQYSIDTFRKKTTRLYHVPNWNIDALKLMMGIVYVYAGLAKLNSDWLLNALPLKIWLPARNEMPIIGWLFNYEWVAFLFSWIGCIYDLSIPFLLLKKNTRPFAYLAVVIFHILTALLFPIGMFPHIMIVAALVFFPASFHQKIIDYLCQFLQITQKDSKQQTSSKGSRFTLIFFVLFFTIQLALPFRYLAYPGELFWTEEGYRFSWRVMLMEKAGYAQFTIKDQSGQSLVVNNAQFLSPLQEKMMATQPDMLLQYAHILGKYYNQHGFRNTEVYVDSYVALNGRLGKALVKPTINLSTQKESFQHKTWLTEPNAEIKGF